MIASEVKRIRLKFELSQEAFAKVFGFSGPVSVSNIETGFRRPSRLLVIMLNHLDILPQTDARKLITELSKNIEFQKHALTESAKREQSDAQD